MRRKRHTRARQLRLGCFDSGRVTFPVLKIALKRSAFIKEAIFCVVWQSCYKREKPKKIRGISHEFGCMANSREILFKKR